jgi:hypothetical protein
MECDTTRRIACLNVSALCLFPFPCKFLYVAFSSLTMLLPCLRPPMAHKCGWNPCPFGVKCRRYRSVVVSSSNCPNCKRSYGSGGRENHHCAICRSADSKPVPNTTPASVKEQFQIDHDRLKRRYRLRACSSGCNGRPHRQTPIRYCDQCRSEHLSDIYGRKKRSRRPRHRRCKTGSELDGQSHSVFRIQWIPQTERLVPVLRVSNCQATDDEFYSEWSPNCKCMHFYPDSITTKHNEDGTPAIPHHSWYWVDLKALVQRYGGEENPTYYEDLRLRLMT